MNRHDRRADQKRQTQGEPAPNLPDFKIPVAPANSGLQLPAQQTSKPSWVVRILAKVMLSRWVIARVEHPDVERLLINFAYETGRPEIADELIRRQALRQFQ